MCNLMATAYFSIAFTVAKHFVIRVFASSARVVRLMMGLLVMSVFLRFKEIAGLMCKRTLGADKSTVFPIVVNTVFVCLFTINKACFLKVRVKLLTMKTCVTVTNSRYTETVKVILE